MHGLKDFTALPSLPTRIQKVPGTGLTPDTTAALPPSLCENSVPAVHKQSGVFYYSSLGRLK